MWNSLKYSYMSSRLHSGEVIIRKNHRPPDMVIISSIGIPLQELWPESCCMFRKQNRLCLMLLTPFTLLFVLSALTHLLCHLYTSCKKLGGRDDSRQEGVRWVVQMYRKARLSLPPSASVEHELQFCTHTAVWRNSLLCMRQHDCTHSTVMSHSSFTPEQAKNILGACISCYIEAELRVSLGFSHCFTQGHVNEPWHLGFLFDEINKESSYHRQQI